MICEIFPVLNFHQLFPASFGWRTKRQSNTTLDAGGDLGYWFRAAQAAGVSSASRWMETSAKPGNTAPR